MSLPSCFHSIDWYDLIDPLAYSEVLRLIMDKKQLIGTIKRILRTEADLSFLSQLKECELETLLASVRDCVENSGDGVIR